MRIRSFNRNCDGVIAVEFSLLLPVMAVVLFGSFEATRLVRASMKVWNAAQSISDLVAQQTTVSSSKISDFCTGGSLTLAPFTGSLNVTVTSVTYSASGSRAVDWEDTTCGGVSISNAVSLATNYTPNLKDSVIVAKAQYTYSLPKSYVLPSSFTFVRYSYSRPRSGTQVAHS